MNDGITRNGLPPELGVLLARYPRQSWTDHDNFSGLVAFWLDRHLMFRELSARLIDPPNCVWTGPVNRR